MRAVPPLLLSSSPALTPFGRKLAEREATTEAYVRDLEAKLKDYSDLDDTHGTAVSDLRKEISRNREQALTTEQYVRALEERLKKSNETSAQLRRQIEVLEKDVLRREEAYRDLEGRLTLLDTTGAHKQLLAELDERARRVQDLERSVDALKSSHFSSEQEAARMSKLAALEREAKEELQSRVRTLERASVQLAAATKVRPGSFTPPQTPADGPLGPGDPLASVSLTDPALVASLEQRIADLQHSYDRTLVELESANDKYHSSLREIELLNSNVDSERALLSSSDLAAASASSPSSTTGPDLDLDSDTEVLADVPTTITAATLSSPNRTPRSRRSMPLAPGNRLSFLGRGGQATPPPKSHLRSASLSQELSSAQGLLSSPPSPSRANSPNAAPLLRTSASRESLSGHIASERTYDQMKHEVMKLQSVLKEREDEIALLEASLHHSQSHSRPSSVHNSPVFTTNPTSSANGSYFHTPRTGSPEDGEGDPAHALSPTTVAAFEKLKADLQLENAGEFPIDAESSARLDEIMRSMAKKEEGHREVIDDLQDQLAALKRQHADLTLLSRDQVRNMSSEIQTLRTELEARPDKNHLDANLGRMMDALAKKDDELGNVRERAERDLASTSARLVDGPSSFSYFFLQLQRLTLLAHRTSTSARSCNDLAHDPPPPA